MALTFSLFLSFLYTEPMPLLSFFSAKTYHLSLYLFEPSNTYNISSLTSTNI